MFKIHIKLLVGKETNKERSSVDSLNSNPSVIFSWRWLFGIIIGFILCCFVFHDWTKNHLWHGTLINGAALLNIDRLSPRSRDSSRSLHQLTLVSCKLLLIEVVNSAGPMHLPHLSIYFFGGPAVKSGGGLAAWTRCPLLTHSSVSFSAGSPSLGGGEFPPLLLPGLHWWPFYFCWAMRGFQRVPSYRAVLQDCCSPRAPSYWAHPGARRGRDGSAEPH